MSGKRVIRGPFSGGWQPSSDANNAPSNSLLRMDNLLLDDRGVPVLRKGVTKLYTLAGGSDVHSLFTSYIGGTRFRMAGAGDSVFKDGETIGVTMAGSGDTSFGSFMGQIFMARSTSKTRMDGSGVKFDWGVAAPSVTPTTAARDLKSEVITTCATGEANSDWSVEPSEAESEHQNDRNGSGGDPEGEDQSREVTADGDGRAFLTNTFSVVKDTTDFGIEEGDQSSPNDTFEFYLWRDEPHSLTSFQIQFDCDDGDFIGDVYFYSFDLTVTGGQSDIPSFPTAEAQFASEWDSLTTFSQEDFDRIVEHPNYGEFATGANFTALQPIQGQEDEGWTKIILPRSAFARGGSTEGKGWNSIKGIQFLFVSSSGGAKFRVSDVQFKGSKQGTLLGEYRYLYQFVRHIGSTSESASAMEYEVVSAPSPLSVIKRVESRGMDITVPQNATTDTQVTQAWIYRAGGFLPGYYRVGTMAYTNGTHYGTGSSTAATFEDLLSDVEVLTVGIPLAPNLGGPPDGIIDIEGPHFDRLFCLDSTTLYPSSIRRPDSYDSGEEILVADTGETAYWIKRAYGNLYVGTSRDIYVIQGTFVKQPDGTLDVRKVPLNIGNPPISKATAQEGNNLIYLAADGWRVFNGHTSASITHELDLLYKGETRHGVSPVNISSATARFRAAISKGRLTCVTPEGSDTTKSKVLHRFDTRAKKWFRHTWTADTWSWQNVYREPDGTLIGCDDERQVWEIDVGTVDEGGGTTADKDISVVLWTRVDDMDTAGQKKDFWGAHVVIYTGSEADSASLAFHDDGNSVAALTKALSNTVLQPHNFDISDIGIRDHSIQLRLTGSFNNFQFNSIEYQFLERWVTTQFWEDRPENPSRVRRRFGGFTGFLDTLGSVVTATPIDSEGRHHAAHAINTGEKGPTPFHVPTQNVVTRDMWLRLEGVNPFEFGDLVAITHEDLPQQSQGRTPALSFDTDEQKVVSGIEIRYCTLGEDNIEITPVFDGVLGGQSFTLPNDFGRDEFQTHTLNFTDPVAFTEGCLDINKPIEIKYWKPIGLYVRPAPKKVWDSGWIDMNGHDLNWLKEVRVKGIFQADIEITVYFEGAAETTQTITVPSGELNKMTIFSARMPRTFKGRQPRFKVKCGGTEFYPEWLDFWMRPSGNQGRRAGRRKVRVLAGSRGVRDRV